MGLFGRGRMSRPVAGFAEVVETWPPPLHTAGAGAGNCRMRLRLEVAGFPPLVVDHHETLMTVNRWPEVGMRAAVTVDADHPEDLDVDWDSIFGKMPGGLVGHAAEMLAGAAGADIDLSPGPPRDPHQVQMSVEEFSAYATQLRAEFAAGRITYEDLAARLQRANGG